MGWIRGLIERVKRRSEPPSAPSGRPAVQPSIQPAKAAWEPRSKSAKGKHPLRLFEPAYLSRATSGPLARDMTYAAIDVETTGLDHRRHRICEVAIVRFRGDGTVLGEYATLINPQRKLGQSTEIHGISDGEVASAPTFVEALPDILRMLSGCVVVAHHMEFEDKFLKSEIERAEHSQLNLVGLCSLITARAQLDGPFYSLKTLYRTATGKWIEDAHTALGDTRALVQLVSWLLGTAPTPLHYVGPEVDTYTDVAPAGRIQPRAVQLTNRKHGYLGSLAKRFPHTGLQHPVDPAIEAAYIEALDEILADHRIVDDEGWRMEKLARRGGFSQQHLVQLHRQAWYRATAADPIDTPETMTSQRRNQLAQLAHDLGHRDLGERLVIEVTETAATTRYLRNWRVGIDGPDEQVTELAEFVASHGGSVAKRLTKTVRFVAAADPDADSPLLRKARELELTIVPLALGAQSLRDAVLAEETRARAALEEQQRWRQRREKERAEQDAYYRHQWRRRENPPVWGWDGSASPIVLPRS